jgi:hypothetical protein
MLINFQYLLYQQNSTGLLTLDSLGGFYYTPRMVNNRYILYPHSIEGAHGEIAEYQMWEIKNNKFSRMNSVRLDSAYNIDFEGVGYKDLFYSFYTVNPDYNPYNPKTYYYMAIHDIGFPPGPSVPFCKWRIDSASKFKTLNFIEFH